jgi:hypothetical protein
VGTPCPRLKKASSALAHDAFFLDWRTAGSAAVTDYFIHAACVK